MIQGWFPVQPLSQVGTKNYNQTITERQHSIAMPNSIVVKYYSTVAMSSLVPVSAIRWPIHKMLRCSKDQLEDHVYHQLHADAQAIFTYLYFAI